MKQEINRDVEKLYPTVASALKLALSEAKKKSLPVEAFETIRLTQRQGLLLASGATKKKTSWHLFGLAVDLYPKINGKWLGGKDLDKWYAENYKELSKIMKKYGFVCGGDWKTFKDYVHFEMTFNLKDAILYSILLKNGIAKVWEYIDGWRKK